MKRGLKILLGALVGGAAGFGIGYILKDRVGKPKGEVVYEVEAKETTVEKETEVEAEETVEKIVEKEQYIQNGGWRAVTSEMFDMADGLDRYTYEYFKEDEILSGPIPSMEEADEPELFDAAYSAADAGQRELWMANVDLGEKAHILITEDDYAEKFQEWSDMQFESAEVPYSEEE